MLRPAKGYAKFSQPLLQRMLRWPAIALMSHWLFQSLTYMSATERWFKLAFDLLLTVGGGLILGQWLPFWSALLLAWGVAHTLNGLANGHLWGVLKHYGYTNWSYEAFQVYTRLLLEQAAREPSINRILVYGSIARQDWSSSSDLDLRIVRQAGWVNGLRACWFLMRQRSRALLAGFPLDAYLIDRPVDLGKLAADERPIVLYAALSAAQRRAAAPAEGISASIRRWLGGLGEVLLLSACVLPGLIFSAQGLQEPWNTFRLARAQMSVQSGHILPYVTAAAGYRSEHIGVEIIDSALIRATAWSLEALALVPIGALLLALVYYGLTYTITRSRLWAALITVFVSWYYPSVYSQFGTQTYVWVYVQFLGFLLVLWLWLQQQTRALSLMLVVLFVSTFLSYHTTPLWMIMALFSAVAGVKLAARRPGAAPSQASWALPIVCTVFYFTFDTVFRSGLTRVSSGVADESLLQSFISKVLAPFLNRTPASLDPFEIAPVNPRLATWTTLAVLLLLVVPVPIWWVRTLRRALASRSLSDLVPDRRAIFIWTIGLVAGGHALLYMVYGSLSFRVVPLAFPLLLPLLATTKRGQQVTLGIGGLLAGCAIIGFTSFAPTLQPDTLASQTGLATRLIPAQSQILADANLYGSLLLQSSETNKVLDLTWVTPENYQAVVEDRPAAGFAYVAMSTAAKPLTSSNWQFFAPWTATSGGFARHTQFDQIYASDQLVLMQSAGRPLSAYQPVSGDLAAAPQPFLTATIRLWLALVGLIVAPGIALAWLAQRQALFGPNADIRTMSALAVGLGVANLTLMGYLANFTPLGLAWMIPLSLGLPLLGLLILVVRQRGRVQIAPAWLRYGATVIIVTVIWATLATSVATSRSASPAALSEFFVTQTQPDTLTFHLTNASAVDQDLVLAITAGTQVVEERTLHIPAGGVSSEQWTIGLELEGQPASISVLKQGQPLRTLHIAALKREL